MTTSSSSTASKSTRSKTGVARLCFATNVVLLITVVFLKTGIALVFGVILQDDYSPREYDVLTFTIKVGFWMVVVSLAVSAYDSMVNKNWLQQKNAVLIGIAVLVGLAIRVWLLAIGMSA